MKARTAGHMPTWRLAARVARYRLGLYATAVVLLAAANALLLGIGLILRWVFDALSGAAPAGLGVYGLSGVLVAAEVARMAAVWGGVVWTACWEQMSGLLRLNLLHAQMQSGGPEAGTILTSSGEAVSNLRDDTDDFLRFLDTGTWVAGRALFAAGAAALMLRIDPVVTVAVALPLAAVVVAAKVVSGRIRAYRHAARAATTAVSAFFGEVFGAALAIKAAHAAQAVRRSAALNQAGVAVERLTPLLPASSPAALVASRPLYVSGRQPPATAPTRSSPWTTATWPSSENAHDNSWPPTRPRRCQHERQTDLRRGGRAR